MDPASAAGIGIGGSAALVAIVKVIRRLLGFKSCKWTSKSDNEECIFGCRATKRQKIETNTIKECIPQTQDLETLEADKVNSKNDERQNLGLVEEETIQLSMPRRGLGTRLPQVLK